ncbi:TniB family NTP-binding protein [Streptomyces sp. NBC_00825]|uniref:TniB family NTP-binding protein n=1 Tax=unclassified Streptomyces TaxID=2593676 RepID=UPI002ED3D090|nr:TniB family NTP-binding protein [Streptomyces sp. NBC_00826]WTH89061.1 TniB family NTP-binding protein [Streptomyces sp. NBC_00825]WTH97791.1 TniB family NTP-binding protein [Streptomyces sp. NBC_00822]
MSDHNVPAEDNPVPFLRFGPRPDRTTYEGWQEFRKTRELFVPVKKITLAEYRLMSPRKKSLHDLHRAATHVNMQLLETPMSVAVTDLMRSRIQNNAMRFGPGTLDGLMINGGGYQGKTETACRTAAEFEDDWRKLFEQYRSHYVDAMPGTRDLIAPIAYCQTPVKATPIGLCEAILDFYGAPYGKNLRGMIRNVRESIKAHATTVLMIDDITRLKMHREDDQDTLDLIRGLMDLDVTLVLIGVNIPRSGLLREGWHDPRTKQWVYAPLTKGKSYNPDASTQTERRFDLINLDPFDYSTTAGTEAFTEHLIGIENQIRLFHTGPGTLSEGNMPEYLRRRTHGIVGLLRRLIEDGLVKAMDSGLEDLTTGLLDEIPINLGNVPGKYNERDAEAGEIPDVDTTPQPKQKPQQAPKKGRNKVYDDPGTPAAVEA